jgi:prolyl-tRNA synthetase
MKPGAKYYEWEGRGVPLRLEIGPRDVAAGTVILARRTGGKKESLPLAGLPAAVTAAMDAMQHDMLETARARREANSIRGASKEQFLARLEAGGGFIYSGFCGRTECEMEIKEQTKATIRVLPDEEFRSPTVPATCIWCNGPTVTEAVWARAY